MSIVLTGLTNYGIITPVAEEFLPPILLRQVFNSGEFLLREGQYSNRIYFIESGLIHHFKDNGKVNKTNWILRAGDIVVAYAPFFERTKSDENIQAIKTTIVHSISYTELNILIGLCPDFNKIADAIKDEYRIKREDYLALIDLSVDARFQLLLQRNPEFLTLVPHEILASYLHMSPATLSRLKKGNSRRGV